MSGDAAVVVGYEGLRMVGPEGAHVCALLVWPERSRVLPIWITPAMAAVLNSVDPDQETGRERPLPHDHLARLIADAGGPADSGIVITDAVDGVFLAELELADHRFLDLRASDAIALALLLGRKLLVAEKVLLEYGLYMTSGDAHRYLDLELSGVGEPDDLRAGEQDPDATADFERLMREMGVDESDLRGGAEDAGGPDAPDAADGDDNGVN